MLKGSSHLATGYNKPIAPGLSHGSMAQKCGIHLPSGIQWPFATGGATLRGFLPRLATELQKALRQHKAPSDWGSRVAWVGWLNEEKWGTQHDNNIWAGYRNI